MWGKEGHQSHQVYLKRAVLCPLLFLFYIDDLPEVVSSTARLFVDDCLLHRSIKLPEDSKILQSDIDILQQWEDSWLMSFNADKCEVLRVFNKRKPLISTYTIHGRQNTWALRYFVPQVPITGKMLNGYLMFSVKNIVQNVKLIEVLGKNLVPLHFVVSKIYFLIFFP